MCFLQEGVSLDAAAQNLRHVADRSVPVVLNIIGNDKLIHSEHRCVMWTCVWTSSARCVSGLESARAGDYETAFSCFLTAAQHDYSKAQFNLGVCYEKGRGVQADLSKVLGFPLRECMFENISIFACFILIAFYNLLWKISCNMFQMI